MKTQSNIIVVSSFGRGNWLSAELARSGISVTLLDVSEKMGPWSADDAEGPFGLFKYQLRETQMERLFEDDPPENVPQGFTIWLGEGPLELKGPVTKHRLDQLKTPLLVQDYISTMLHSQETEKKVSSFKNKIQDFDFDQRWLAELAHNFTAVKFVKNISSLDEGSPLPLMADFMIRRPSRKGMLNSLEWCGRQGVQVVSGADIKDISFSDRGTVSGLEISQGTQKTTMITAEQFIWCLSGEESGMLGTRVQKGLFPQGVLESDWYWARYRIKIGPCFERDLLPLHCLIIKDLDLPWAHENFMVFQRTTSSELFDVWMRLPVVQRFNKDYLEKRGQNLIETLQDRLTIAKFEIVNFPVGYSHTYQEIGPARYNMVTDQNLRKYRLKEWKNVHFNNFEKWHQFGWNSVFNYEALVFEYLIQWWKKKLEKEAKANQGKNNQTHP